MFYPTSYQMYKYEHGLSGAEQRAADARRGAAAAELRDLRLGLGRLVRHRLRPALAVTGCGAAASAPVLPSVR